MEELKEELLEAKRELALQSYLKDVAEQKTEELSRQIEILNAEISALKQQLCKDTRETSTQTGNESAPSGDVPATSQAVQGYPTEDSLVAPDLLENGIESLAETLRQTAESAMGQSDYVMDASSGMYYDYKSGYYYDPNTCLMYNPHTGTYYRYNEETHSYDVHSRVDLSQYGSSQSTQDDQKLAWEAKKKAKKKESSARKQDSRKKYDRDLERRAAKVERHRKKRSKHKRKKRPSGIEKDKKGGSEKLVQKSLLVEKDGYIVISDDEMSPAEGSGIGGKNAELGNSEGGGKLDAMEIVDNEAISDSKTAGTSQKDGPVRGVKLMGVDIEQMGRSDKQKCVKDVDGIAVRGGASPKGETDLADTKLEDVRDAVETTASDKLSNQNIGAENVTEPLNENKKGPYSKGNMKNVPKNEKKEKVDGHMGGGSESGASDMEEGELSDSTGDSLEDISDDEMSDDISDEQEVTSSGSSTSSEVSDSMEEEEERAESPVNPMDYPPCIRLIVTESKCLPLGSLHIITVLGGTIGREGTDHVIKIPELMVSKMHAEITYEEGKRCYAIKDLGSQNGTLLNGAIIAMGRVQSEAQDLSHRDILQFGSTVFEVHIHQGNWTCPGCEPGLVQARLNAENSQNIQQGSAPVSTADKETLRRRELKKIKKKYNLVGEEYKVHNDTTLSGKYTDRAEERRQVVGSDNPYQQDDAPSSVNRAIDESNKGHQMLLKMGWKEGDSLGTGDKGIKEPIQVGVHSSKAGLGSGPVMPMQLALNRTKKISISWNKSRERLAQSDPLYAATTNPEPKFTLWVQGKTEILDRPVGGGEDSQTVEGEETETVKGDEVKTPKSGDSAPKSGESGGMAPDRSKQKKKISEKIDMFE